MSEHKPGLIYAALQAIREHCDAEGISKSREVTDGVRFKFRGIDDVMNFFSRPLAKNGVMVFPSYDNLVVESRPTKHGVTYNTTVSGVLRFVSTRDGSELVAGPFYGEANDTQDKSTAKAMSIAFRQGFLLTFTVPLGPAMDTEYGDQGGEEAGDEVQPRQDAQPQPQAKSEKPRVRAGADGTVVDPIADGQQRILTARLNSKGLAMSDLVEGGFATVNKSNFNDVIAWIVKQ